MSKPYKFKNEAAFQKKFVAKLRETFGEKIVVIPTTMTGYGMSGVHDVLICFYGMFWTAELKMDGKKPTELQHQFGLKIDRAGGRANMPVTPNPDKEGRGGMDQFIDYLLAVQELKEAKEAVAEVTADEEGAGEHVEDVMDALWIKVDEDNPDTLPPDDDDQIPHLRYTTEDGEQMYWRYTLAGIDVPIEIINQMEEESEPETGEADAAA